MCMLVFVLVSFFVIMLAPAVAAAVQGVLVVARR